SSEVRAVPASSIPGGNRLRHFRAAFLRVVTCCDKNDDNARKIARCRSAMLSGETNARLHASDWTDYLTRLGVADHPRHAKADGFSPPCFRVDRPSTTGGRHIPGEA